MRLCVHSLNLDLRLMNVHMKEGSGVSFALPPLLSPPSIKLSLHVLIPPDVNADGGCAQTMH